ncbi:hypothetical protein HQ529_02435 [Candidatus Woesearchaeota archaeon]|nr:hypothetical protein [Candidatus Woesearchaeota archaeon]
MTNKKFPEYDWIQNRIDDLNKTRSDLEEIGKNIGPKNPFLRESIKEIIDIYLEYYNESVKIAKKENIPISLFVRDETHNGIRYFVITEEEENLNNLITDSLLGHSQDLAEMIKYVCVCDIKFA